VDLFIKGKKFTHPVNVIQELNEYIIRIDFIHAHKLTYDVISCRVKFAGAGTNSIAALKNTVLEAMTSTVVKAKFKGTRDEKATHIANICTPRMPMISGIPSIVNVDENNICNIVVENCTPHDVTLERDDVLGIMETEEDELMILSHQYVKTSITTFRK
jgi:hypothetical protein